MTDPAPPAADVPSHDPAGRPHKRGVGHVFLRGLAITLPSILTVAILIWAAGLVKDYVVDPVSGLVEFSIAQLIRDDIDADGLVRTPNRPELEFVGRDYLLRPGVDAGALDENRDAFVRLGRRAVPYRDYRPVAEHLPEDELPDTANGVYMELATERYFRSSFFLSALAVGLALLAIYFVGAVVGRRVGAYVVKRIEDDVLAKLPVVSRVYGSVKQVTDFFFAEKQISYNSVVAVEYPREGVWSIGFVTGEGMRETVEAAGEPLYSILMPTSPMPMTGFTISAPRSKCRELDLTVEQAFQFCLSCGVLVPPQQSHGGRSVSPNGAAGPAGGGPVDDGGPGPNASAGFFEPRAIPAPPESVGAGRRDG